VFSLDLAVEAFSDLRSQLIARYDAGIPSTPCTLQSQTENRYGKLPPQFDVVFYYHDLTHGKNAKVLGVANISSNSSKMCKKCYDPCNAVCIGQASHGHFFEADELTMDKSGISRDQRKSPT
jgi:hypothetical protein